MSRLMLLLLFDVESETEPHDMHDIYDTLELVKLRLELRYELRSK
jgi:hypothetical protein